MIVLEYISSFCKIIMFVTTIFVFGVGLINRDRDSLIIPFWYLSIFSLFDSILYLYFIVFLKEINTYISITNWTQLVYIFFEFFIISNFLFEINNIKNKKTLKLIIIFVSIIIFFLTFFNNWNYKEKYYSIITLIEIVFINSLAIRYLLIISPDILDQKSKKISILLRGIFLFINISSPYYLITQFVLDDPNTILSSISFINDIAYTVFFTSLIKSLRCQCKK
jgi:hypothetical protein